MISRLAFLVLAFVSGQAIAETCLDHYSTDGNILTGRTYKTWAVVEGVRSADAFTRAYAFTAENGFSILSASKEAGVISAAQSVSYGRGKSVPLTVTLKAEGAGTRITLTYATSGGVVSPEDAIKRHFCMTIAAIEGEAARGTPGSDTGAPPTPPQVASARPSPRGSALPTTAQQSAIEQEISKSIPNDRAKPLIVEAMPAIATFIERVACLVDYTGASAMNEYATPGINLGDRYTVTRPMGMAHYHNKGSCMTVARVQGWTAPANNALRFEVLYKAEDSGEIAKITHEAIKQPDGSWLFSQ